MTLTPELKVRLLLELSQRISRTLDLQVVLRDLLQALRPAVAYDAAGVFVLNRAVPLIRRSDPNLIAGMVQIGFDDPPADDPMLRSGKGIIGHVIHTGEVVNAADVCSDRRYVAGRLETRSELAVPIVSEAGVIGCLNVESDRLAAFSPEDAELPGVLRASPPCRSRKPSSTARSWKSSGSRTSSRSHGRCSPGSCPAPRPGWRATTSPRSPSPPGRSAATTTT